MKSAADSRLHPPTLPTPLLLPIPARALFFALAAGLFLTGNFAVAGPLDLRLPTDNKAIFSEDPSKFYMYTDRNFEGVRSKPWSGGRYGFTRNQKRTNIGIVFTKFHEGIDIGPVRRDSSGTPLDEVRAITDGKVVYVNAVSSRSSYGNYVVIEHDWGEGPFYSLSAHLASASVKAGQPVKAGQIIAKMGYTGAGINRERSHLHLELTMLLSTRFQNWYDRHFSSKNHHGIYSGFNLVGLDIAGLYHSHKANPNLSVAEFARSGGAYYKVAVPKSGKLAILERYPWLGRDMDQASSATSWEISLSNSSVPLEIRPEKRNLKFPAVTWVKPSKTDHAFHTRGLITGVGSKGSLTASGSRYIQLLTGTF